MLWPAPLTAASDAGWIPSQVLSLLTAFALLAQPGCTAVKSGAVLVQAERAMREAQDSRAPSQATYEYALADAYRHKAREEWGNSSYGAAEALAVEALALARKALDQAEFGIEEGLDVDDLDDEDLD
jgi:hypothetical protein